MPRLQKVIADTGYASRRHAEDLIKAGKVTLNGKTALIGQNAHLAEDDIRIEGTPLKKARFVYMMLHKPKGYISTTKPEKGKPPVTDLVRVNERVYPVGRLDLDTEGLLLLTNDGDFSQHVTHPRNEIQKTYRVTLQRPLDRRDLSRLSSGVTIEGRRVDIRKVRVLKPHIVEITIHEGRKHIVKKIFGSMKHHIVLLQRMRVGSLGLGKLPKGKWRYLSQSEVRLLKGSGNRKP